MMAMKGPTAYYTCRRNLRGNKWRVYRVVEDCPDYPGVKWLEEPVSKSVARDTAEHLVATLDAGLKVLS